MVLNKVLMSSKVGCRVFEKIEVIKTIWISMDLYTIANNAFQFENVLYLCFKADVSFSFNGYKYSSIYFMLLFI